MSVSVGDLAILLQNISISSEPGSGLDELKNVLSTLRIDHIQNTFTISQLDLMVLFDCLNTSSREQVVMSTDVLSTLLCASPAAATISRYSVQLERALTHPAEPVRLLVLKQVQRCIDDEEALKTLKLNKQLLKNVISCIGAESLPAAAALAVRVVTSLACGGQQGAALLVFSAPLLDAMRSALTISDTVRYSVYEVAVRTACQSRENMKLVTDVGLLPELVREAFGRDILVQLNALQLLCTLAETDHGLEYLESEGVTHRLEKMLTAPEDSTVADFILPGLLRFFAQLGRLRPAHVLRRYPALAAAVLAMPSEADTTRQLAAFDTIACLGMTAAGKLALNQHGEAMTSCIAEIGRLAQNSPTEIRVRALETLHQLLQLQAGELTPQLLAVSQAWFAAVSPQPLQLVWSIARQPFLDLRLAALQVLTAVAGLAWGQQLLFQRAGFLEYLLDRTTESSKEGRDAKYALVKAVVSSASAGQELAAEPLARLVSYHEQGAFYVRAHTEVALDEST